MSCAISSARGASVSIVSRSISSITESERTLSWPSVSTHLGELRRQLAGGQPFGAAADAVERGAVALRDERRVVVRDQQLFGRRPQHLELARLAEVGLAQQVARHRQDAPLAIFVRRDGVEDRGEAIGGASLERQRGREQLRDLRVVERRGDAARRPAPRVGSIGGLHHAASPPAGRGCSPPSRGCSSRRAACPATSPTRCWSGAGTRPAPRPPAT